MSIIYPAVPTNIMEYCHRVSEHRKRVHTLGLNILKEYTSAYDITTVSPEFHRVLNLHDIEKYLFLSVLWLWFGVRKNTWQKKLARMCFDVMNFVGKQILFIGTLDLRIKSWLKKSGPDSDFGFAERLALALRVERVTDCLDRNTDPTYEQEFGQSNIGIEFFIKDSFDLWVANQYTDLAIALHKGVKI